MLLKNACKLQKSPIALYQSSDLTMYEPCEAVNLQTVYTLCVSFTFVRFIQNLKFVVPDRACASHCRAARRDRVIDDDIMTASAAHLLRKRSN